MEKSVYYKPQTSIKFPPSFSLKSQFPKVRSQGFKRETCSSFTISGLIEFIEKVEDLSEQCLALYSSETDSDSLLTKLDWILQNGLYYEKDCPYFALPALRGKIPPIFPKKRNFVQLKIIPIFRHLPLKIQ